MQKPIPLLALVLFALGFGCGPRYGPDDNPAMVLDASGAEFGWSCDGDGCRVTEIDGTPEAVTCTESTPGWSYIWGRFVALCGVCRPPASSSWSTTPGRCRPLACDTDSDCPALYATDPGDRYECVSGLCQNDDLGRFPRETLDRADIQLLCHADVPRDETVFVTSARSLELSELVTAACEGVSCVLPASCRAP